MLRNRGGGGNGYDQPRKANPKYGIHTAYQPIFDHDQIDPRGTRIQRPDTARDNVDLESNPLEDPVNCLGRDLGLSQALWYSRTRGPKGAGR
ncbi:hypothetical protein BTUL_0023g00400 [Botrytis tulipae]|uniref:Uncharacterized protein n=1 Tax=Botrytis tulipae TaxID=87230 RepID=A0A4Z1EXH8_9HELO|nr:hypothetical protein BTUL_0023g00400 [Botrytis tulipae]